MSTLREVVQQSVINLHRRTQEEWIHLKDIYEEVAKTKEVKNNGASIRAILETHCSISDAFSGKEEYILKEKGTGLYKSIYYDQIQKINHLNIGDVFTRDQLMSLFKISGQSGIMKTNRLNSLVLITSESNSVYGDSLVTEGTILYTGEGLEGDQELTKNNSTLYHSKENNLPIYLFTKDKNRRYIFEGEVELYDKPFQVSEKDIHGITRLVWKFPLQIIHKENGEYEKDEELDKVIDEVIEIENRLEENKNQQDFVFKEGPLNIRKYRKLNRHIQRSSKPDYIAEEIIKSKQGMINEKYIYENEKERLKRENAIEQVKQMEEFFDHKKENEGFDILSFEKDECGNYIEKYIEVKSTKAGESTPIDITIDEIEFAKKHPESYYLYRIIYSDSERRYVKVVKGVDLLKDYQFVPVAFKIYSN